LKIPIKKPDSDFLSRVQGENFEAAQVSLSRRILMFVRLRGSSILPLLITNGNLTVAAICDESAGQNDGMFMPCLPTAFSHRSEH
jgi:hypothetical protein